MASGEFGYWPAGYWPAGYWPGTYWATTQPEAAEERRGWRRTKWPFMFPPYGEAEKYDDDDEVLVLLP